MVSSTAMPMVMGATSRVSVSSGIPSQPINPKMERIGKRLGKSATSPARTEPKTSSSSTEITTSANPKLLICDQLM